MQDFINSSALTKLLANIFIFIVLLASTGIAVYDALTNQQINPYVSALLGGGLTYAAALLGVHVGSVVSAGVTPVSTPAPLEQQGPPAGNAG